MHNAISLTWVRLHIHTRCYTHLYKCREIVVQHSWSHLLHLSSQTLCSVHSCEHNPVCSLQVVHQGSPSRWCCCGCWWGALRDHFVVPLPRCATIYDNLHNTYFVRIGVGLYVQLSGVQLMQNYLRWWPNSFLKWICYFIDVLFLCNAVYFVLNTE